MKVTSLRVGLMAILMSLGAARSTYAQSQSFQYRCDSEALLQADQNRTFQATFSPDQALVNLDDGRTLLMRQVVSASGTRYKNAGYILSTKGNEAFITVNNQMIYQNCLTRSLNRNYETILNFQIEKDKVLVYRVGKQTLLDVIDRKKGAFRFRGVPLRTDLSSMGITYTTLQGENLVRVFESQDGKNAFLQIGDNPPEMTETYLVSGYVTYSEPVELPPNATVRVQLQNVSRADAPATIIAEQTIQNGAQVPFFFDLVYKPTDIDSKGRYVVRAQIFVDNQLRWTSTSAYPVITQGASIDNVEVLVSQVDSKNK